MDKRVGVCDTMAAMVEPLVIAENRLISLWIEGTPRPQSRPRVGAGGHFYSDSKLVREWKKTVMSAMLSVRPSEPVTGAVEATLHFHLPRPKRLGSGGEHPHVSTPDGDNLAKAVLDCAQAAGLIANDSQVYSLRIRKLYAPSDSEAGCFLQLREHR